VRQHKKKQSWCKFLFTQMQNILQASGGNKSKTICTMWSEKLHINVRLLLVLRFENGATNRQTDGNWEIVG
jgi:hypothetical protein